MLFVIVKNSINKTAGILNTGCLVIYLGLDSQLVTALVIGCLTRDGYIMRVTLNKPGAGDAQQTRVGT